MMKRMMATVWIVVALVMVAPLASAFDETGFESAPTAPLPVVKAELVEMGKTAVLPSSEPLRVIVHDEDYAYIGRDGEVVVLDMTPSPVPTVVMTASLPAGEVEAIEVWEEALYVKLACELVVFERGVGELTAMPALELPCDDFWRDTKMVLDGDMLYINHENGFYVIDVTEPLTPALLANYDGVSYGMTFDVEDNMVYFFGWADLHIVDVSTPQTPTLAQYHDEMAYVVYGVDVVDGQAYTTVQSSKLVVYDVQDPANLAVTREASGVPFKSDMVAVAGNYAYVASSVSMVIFEVSPEQPLGHVGDRVNLPGIRDLALSEDGVTLLTTRGIFGVDVSSPTNPTIVKQWLQFRPSTFANSVVQDGMWYVTDGAGVWLFDVSQPDKIVPTAWVYVYRARHIAVKGNYLYVTGRWGDGLLTIDVSNPYAPVIVDQQMFESTWFITMTQYGDLLYFSSWNTVRVMDVTSGGSPVEVLAFDMGGIIVEMVAIEDQLIILDDTGMLTIIDMSVPTQPTVVSSTPVVGEPTGVTVAENKIYVGAREKINIFDMSDPSSLMLQAVYEIEEHGNTYIQIDRLLWHDGVLYGIARWGDGVFVLDVRTPTEPREIGRWPAVEAMATDGGSLYRIGDREAARGVLTPVITGRVHDRSRYGVADVPVTVDGTTLLSDEVGQYRFESSAFGTHSVEPTASGYRFWPPTYNVTTPLSASGADFTMIPMGEAATVSPATSQTVGYEDVRGQQLAVTIPQGAAAVATTVWLTPTVIDTPIGYSNSGHSFVLALAEVSGPMTVTLHYDEADLRLLADEAELGLYRWDGVEWVHVMSETAVVNEAALVSDMTASGTRSTTEQDVQGCIPHSQHDLENNVIEVTICEVGAYAFLGRNYSNFIPLAMFDAPTTLPPNGDGVTQIRIAHSGLCLSETGDFAVQSPCNDSWWELLSAGDGVFQLRLHNTDRCLVHGNSATLAERVMVQPCHAGDDAQHWSMHSVGSYTQFIATTSQLCLDIFGLSLAEGQDAILWTCTGTRNQLWYMANS